MIMMDIFLTGAPYGHLVRKHLGTLEITNDTTGTWKSGNYKATFLDPGGKLIAESIVKRFPRGEKDVWELLKETMKSMKRIEDNELETQSKS